MVVMPVESERVVNNLRLFVCLFAICCLHDSGNAQLTDAWIEDNLDDLAELYFHLHTHPELSYHEKNTSARIAEEWKKDGFDVTTSVGGFGVVALLKNGDGPALMLRTDLDALPVTEATGVDYPSRAIFINEDGTKVGVMHACGHDIHMTNLVGTARFLADHKELWRGTLMLIGQPAEERGGGAKAMLEDGLFKKFPTPDFAIALHVAHDMAAGKVGVRAGYSLANVDSVDITVKGRGGHGSAPHTTVDPIIQAAELVVALQSIVSREVKPIEPAVVTVGSIHGGTKHNIIGDTCKLQLTVRTYSPDVRKQVLAAIERKAKAVAVGHRAELPDVKVSEGIPSLYNNDELASRMKRVFSNAIENSNVVDVEPVMGGEDFSLYGKAGVPILMYRLGSVSQRRLEQYRMAGRMPPSLHSAVYYPDWEPTLRTGIRTMTAAVLELMPPATR